MQIKTRNLTHTFDIGQATEFTAIDNVTTTINQGEFIAIVGHTGSGKTTFIEHLNALLRPSSGEVQIADKIITKSRKKIRDIKKYRKRVGIVFQFAEYQLFEETIEKDIIFGPVSMGVSKADAIKRAHHYIDLVGLNPRLLSKSPFSLSGGQKRRVALAGILAMEPDILILDEPTAGLDPQGAIDTYKIFEKLHSLGKAIVVVTHNLDHVLEHTERTMLFRKGKLIEDGLSVDILYDIENIIRNELEPPKMVVLVSELEKRGLKIGKVRSINELAKVLRRQWK